MLHSSRRTLATKLALLSATMLAGASPALVQAQSAPAAAPKTDDSTVVVVTGYRASLRNATKAKKDSTNFTETIFSEDLGKFPDINLAESMQRVPGMIVARDAFTGDGAQISVRALPSAFTQITMDGNRVAMASDFGFTGSSSPNRQVDLDAFPTGLFNRIDVAKTPSSDQLEGGIAGTVNIQNARPFDQKGEHGSLAIQDSYSANARTNSPRLTGVWSKTWDKFGVLVGVTSTQKKVFSDGFETVGWGDPSFNNYCGSCDPGASFPLVNGAVTVNNPAGSNQWSWGQTVYGYTGNGLTPGTLNESQLLALNPGMTEATMKGAILPRLGRDYVLDGTSKNKVGLVALEFRPADNLKFNLDILGGDASRVAERSDMMLAVRGTSQTDNTYNGGMIPLNMAVDANDVVTKATLANAAFFEETNFYRDKTKYGSVNGGFEWRMTDTMRLDGNLAYMKSNYERDVTFLKFLTPFQSNITATYANVPGNDMPTITPSVNVNDPNIGWRAFTGQFALQRDKRDVTTKSAHINFTNDAGDWTFKTGYAYDTYVRHINITDNTTAMVNAWNAAIPAGTVGNYMKVMNTPLYRDGVSGAGFNKFVTPDINKIAPAINYSTLFNNATNVDLGNTYNGAGASNISETINSAYMMAFNRSTLFNVPVKSNFGVRWQTTDQVITSPSNINSQIVITRTEHRYHDMLPSFNAVANITDQFNLRLAASRTMTRANPSQMSSQVSYSDPSGQNASAGNPALKPFYSNNLDFGGEYYTGKTGYIGLTFYSKNIKNFTQNSNIVETFSQLGIPYASLGITQQTSLAGAVGHTVTEVLANPGLVANNAINLSTTVNLASRSKLSGTEFMWVQPLDNFVSGLGYTFNYTNFAKSTLLNIPNATYNFTGYYEHGGFSIHVSYVNVGKMEVGVLPSANSIPYNQYQKARHQIDLSAAYAFKAFGVDQSITLDGTNLDNQGFRQYEGFDNIPYGFNNPGQTYILGWRAKY
jgi:TonB-dependent receptor